jgi:hypothetical protein
MAQNYQTTYVWNVTQMSCVPQYGNYTNIVITAVWQCVASRYIQTFFDAADPETVDDPAARAALEPQKWKVYTSKIGGTTQFSPPSGSFTAYDKLTESQVLGWIWSSGVNKASIESSADGKINNQISPPVTNPPLPWKTA